MGSGSKTHLDYYPIGPARWRPADAVDVRDDRPAGATELAVATEALEQAMAAAGVKAGGDTEIRLRLRAQDHPGQQGHCTRLGKDSFRVVVRVADKPEFADRHLYVINNSLVHELRHVAQMQTDPNHASAYAHQQATAGYQHNTFEVEARQYGRLADHTGTKDTGEAGPALGKALWAIHPPPEPSTPTEGL